MRTVTTASEIASYKIVITMKKVDTVTIHKALFLVLKGLQVISDCSEEFTSTPPEATVLKKSLPFLLNFIWFTCMGRNYFLYCFSGLLIV